jgi:hypothetical protein
MSRGLVNNMLTMNNLGDGSTLSLDFTTMGGVLDPRLTFSRASTATFVNSSGYVEYAGANLQRYSETFATTSSAWYHTAGTISTGTSTAPDGTTNCKKCSEPNTGTSAGYIQLFGTTAGIVQGLSHTISMWVKAGTRSRILFSVDSASKQIGFDVTAGQTTPTPTVVTGSLLGYSQTPYPDNWYLCSFSWLQVNVSGSYPGFYTATGTGSTYTNSYPCNGSYIEIFGFQLNPGSTAQTYYPTTTAAYHAPRFDYSPTNIGQPRGLLVEGQAVNSAIYSENINPNSSPQNIYWVVAGAGASVTPVSQTDPANGSTASRCILGTSTVGRVYQAISTTSGATYTMSFWAKSVSGNTALHFWHYNSATGNYTAVTVGTSWARYQVTILARSGGGFVEFGIANLTSTAATIDLWGLQIELGSGASSYIPTGASQVTRNRDTAVMSDISALNYTNAAGTLFVDFTNNTENANYAGSIAFNNGANYAQRFRLGVGSLLVSYFQTNGITGLGTNLFGVRTSFARAKAASSYSFDGTTTTTLMSMNGAAASVTPSSSAAASVSIPTNLSLNSDNSSGALDYVSMTIRSIKYFPTAKSLVDMNGLTT